LELGTWNSEFGTWNSERVCPAWRENLKLGIWNVELGTCLPHLAGVERISYDVLER